MIKIARRAMLGGGIAAIGSTAVPDWLVQAAAAAEMADSVRPGSSVRDETFWHSVAQAYDLDSRHVVMNGGGNNPLPRTVVNALCRYQRTSATQPRPHNYDLIAYRKEHRRRLASHFGCDAEELALTRGTTEGLNTVAWGLSLDRGDEIVMSQYEASYGRKIFAQRAARHGVVVREVNLPVAPSVQEVVDAYAAAISPRTKLLVASHVVDSWGFVLPIRELSELAHDHGAQMLADGALGFGHMPIDVKELKCDYYATSLHKWLNAPLGTGALYVRRDRIRDVWPLYGVDRPADDIRKFEVVGTRDGAPIAAIGPAIDLFERIGPARKLARLRYLLDELMAQLEGADGVSVITERDPDRRVALARVAVD
ncbi:MAG: aminotransferase class V-fold PLP-dependent enzyme, partial [Pseudomonadota bacterium]